MQIRDYLKNNNHIVKDVWININCNEKCFRNEVDLYKLLEGNAIEIYYTFCGFVSVCPLHKASSYRQMLMGQIAQNRCYRQCGMFSTKAD